LFPHQNSFDIKTVLLSEARLLSEAQLFSEARGRESGMAQQESGTAAPGRLTGAALRALLGEGKLAGSWALDPARSQIRLETRHTWGLRPLHGVFRQVTGHGTVTEAGDATGVVTVAAGSVDTKNATRDKHLRSADFFDVATHPDFTFTAESVTLPEGASAAGAGVRVAGRLTIRGQGRPVTLDAKVSGDGGELGLDGELRVNRGDFGMTWNRLGIAAMDNTIVVHAVFTRQ
jgi:polyisoprenoid-binding protein YceI